LQVESLRPRVVTLLQRALLDNDDEVRWTRCLHALILARATPPRDVAARLSAYRPWLAAGSRL